MSRYLVEVIVQVQHFITVEAGDEDHAIQLAEWQQGEHGQPSAPEFIYKRPKLLGGTDGQ